MKALARALLIFVLGCSQARDSRTRVEFWALGREGEEVIALVREFERENPGIDVEVQQMPWTAAHEKLLTAFVGDSTPDVAHIGNSWIPEFEAIGAIASLDRFRPDPSDFFPGIWATNKVDGKLYGVPWYVDTRVMLYRTDMIPRPPRTWSEWVRVCAEVRAAGHKYAILLPTNEWPTPVTLGIQSGSTLLRDGGRYGDFSAPAFRRGFDFYMDFFRRGDAPVISATQVANLYQQFAAGDFAMYIMGPWQLGELRRRLPKEMEGKWSTAPMPAPDGQPYPGTSLAGGGSLAIFERSQQKEAAWKLIEFLTRPRQQVRFFELTGNLPARRSAWDAPVVSRDRELAAFRTQLENVSPMPAVPQWEQIATSVFDFAEIAIRGHLTRDQALKALDAKTNQILEKRRWILDRKAAS
jgi:multiple sugar transport system substrate-binding protein